MSKKDKKLFITVLILVIIMAILYFLTRKDTTQKLNGILLNNGFYETEDINVLQKQISVLDKLQFEENMSEKKNSNFDSLYFNIHEYELHRDYQKYFDGVLTSLLAKYSYQTEELTYTYRITSDNLNVIFNGDYNNDTFTCEVTFSSTSGIKDIKEEVCDSLESDIKDFRVDVITLIKNAKLEKEMKKK